MRGLLLCLVPCWLLTAAPSGPGRPPPPPERPVPALAAARRPTLDDAQMERLARERPVDFVEECLLRYRDTVRGYTLTMSKQERIGGTLQKPELLRVAFRGQPFSVALHWLHGEHRAERVLYVEGENDDRMLVVPAGAWRLAARLAGRLQDGVTAVDVDGDDARQAGRFTIREFGLYNGLARLYADWRAARDRGALHVEYLGEQAVEAVGGRRCLVLRRTRFLRPERDGITEQVLYVDKTDWLQVGTVARREGDEGDDGLIGAYFYRDIVLNPPFEPDPFTRQSLTR
jgi:hypothetical protein